MMSRRKQLKPRALKRDDDDEDGQDDPVINLEEEARSPDSHSDGRQSPDEAVAPSCGEDADEDQDDDDDEEEEIDGEYRCETCDSLFKSLNAFMDHRNFVCTGHHDNESLRGRSRSSSPLSSGSDRKTPVSPLSVMTETNEADLLYSVGVDETHPYQCQFCERAYMRLSHLKKHEQVHADLLPFKCDYCLRLFRHKRSRDRHVKLHTGDKKHKCPKCHSAFARSDHLKIHLRSHDNGKPYRCQQCNRGYTNAAALSSHTMFHKRYGQNCAKAGDTQDEQVSEDKSPNRTPEPPTPEREEEDQKPLSLVMEKSNNTPSVASNEYSELICEFCLKTGFSNKDVLDMHIQMLHAGKSKAPYLCPFCNAAYPTFYNLAEHVRLLHEPMFMTSSPPYNCDICSKSYKTIHELAAHREKIHKYPSTSLSSLTYLCPQCSMPCANQASLIEHMQLVHPPAVPMDNEYIKERPIFPNQIERGRQSNDSKSSLEMLHCDRCNLQFSDTTKFKEHIKSHVSSPTSNGQTTPNSNSGRLSCKECTQHFDSEEQLETHTFMHYLSLTTEYGCTSCLKLFTKPDELQKHLMDIHAHHLYRCALCKEVFDSKVNVQVHFAVKHSNECKLYKCTACSSIFRSEMEWQLHVKVNHLCLSKPYRCLFCKDSFSSEVELQCHLTEHKKQFSCPLCDEAFHVEYLLDKHMQSKHSPESEEKTSRPSSEKSSPQKELDFSIKMEASELLSCQICEVKFQDESQLLTHLVQNHQLTNMGQISPKSLIGSSSSQDSFCNLCVYCNQNFKSKGDLERHMKSHSLPTSLKCNICDEVFPSTNILAEHKLIHCKVVQGNNCVVCKFSLKNESQFYFHAEQHGFQGTNMLCVICRQTLMSTVELNMHAKFHFQSSNSFYTCCVCLKSFNSKENLVAKLNSSGRAYYVCKPCYHGGEEEVGCQQCPKKFETQNELDHHVLVTHVQPTTPPKDEKPKQQKQNRSFFTCCVCLKAFESQENLVPKLNASGRAYYVCKPCYHGNDPSEENRCTWCAMTFPTVTELEAHVQIHKKSYQCIKCQQSFATEYEIQIHVATHMMQEGNVHECRLCGRIFESPAKLQCHLIEHTFDQAEFRCYICEMTFATAPAIQAHVLEHGVAGRRYSCTQCSQKFFFTSELHNHLLSHTYLTENGTDFKCPECSSTFTNVMVLNNHRKLHEPSQANIKCSLCPETFSSIAEMQQHFFSAHLTADKDKRHQCTECQKDFPSQSQLLNHMKTSHSGKENRRNIISRSPPSAYFPLPSNHSLYGNQNGGKLHQCHVCAKPFNRRSALKEHMKCHSCQNPSLYKCEYCEDTFSQGRVLAGHVTDHHKQQYLSDVSLVYHDRRSPQSNGSYDSASGSDHLPVNDINENGIKDPRPPEMNGLKIKREAERDDVTSAKRIKLNSPMLEVKIEPGLESVA